MRAVQFLTPPSPTIRDKVGPLPAAFDADAVARAEAALACLSENFDAWLGANIDRLETARQKARASGFAEAETEELHWCAHDIKGLGGTLDYPLATMIAGSLCRLISTPEARAQSRIASALIEAHVDALRAIARGQVRDPNDPMGRILAYELQLSVGARLGAE